MSKCRNCETEVLYLDKRCSECGCINPAQQHPNSALVTVFWLLFSLVSAYIGWKNGGGWTNSAGLWPAVYYGFLGAVGGGVVGFIIAKNVTEERADKLNGFLSVSTLAFIAWVLFF